ncbi:MAG TPA: META domain-containing protein [Methanocorpusculum sp.]|jgi:heat shock protein HslJ|nr:META domain-containing protein [Methanocorpusculum sp.]MEE1136685.1 META domain-containing protein [Methanocorpusculum sp.]HJJ62170.1 META domain-containing protein [Methanocorpusculum sp.]HJJ77231.1 META domain-containing protein [Methanocorpusculum sp.]HJJ80572.1 META domain-containing protein [Methanocorpusculum sp.]
MRKTAFVVLALALVGIVAAAGCISTETQSPEGYWTLPGTDVLMTITPEGSVLGKAPVNLFSGFCTVEGDRISFNIGATLMTDSEEERAFFAALNSADSFKIVDGKLVLMSEGKEVLTFAKAVLGTWTTEDGIVITFNRDMTFSANGPVNLFSGSYAYTENGIEFTNVLSTMAFGSEEDMAAEAAFLAVLANPQTFSVDNGKLTLGKLTLTASVVGNWVTFDGIDLSLAEDGSVSGKAQVNTFMGEFEEADGKITFKNIVSTKMMGAPEDMEAEAAFFEALEANTFQDGKFLTADGVTFIRA